jgi:hypothetical protein
MGFDSVKDATGNVIQEGPCRSGRTFAREHWIPRSKRADHPHACGENLSSGHLSVSSIGPSPRVWGELLNRFMLLDRERTIPTRVGRTKLKRRSHELISDHPHACGENKEARMIMTAHVGPSPRVWGEQALPDLPAGALRTIPTRVGRTVDFQQLTTQKSAPRDVRKAYYPRRPNARRSAKDRLFPYRVGQDHHVAQS